MKSHNLQSNLTTAGGRITCPRCQARSKRTKNQCGKPALKGKRVCQFHGGRSTGAKTKEGRLRIAHSKTQHGNETRQIRAERSAISAKLLAMEEILFLINAATGPRTRGRKPENYTPITTLETAFEYMTTDLLHCNTPVKRFD
jgi:hypothetical protein